MSVKAFLKNEQKKRNKDTEIAAPPVDTPAEQAPVAETVIHAVLTDAPTDLVREVVNGEVEAVDVAGTSYGVAVSDAHVRTIWIHLSNLC